MYSEVYRVATIFTTTRKIHRAKVLVLHAPAIDTDDRDSQRALLTASRYHQVAVVSLSQLDSI